MSVFMRKPDYYGTALRVDRNKMVIINCDLFLFRFTSCCFMERSVQKIARTISQVVASAAFLSNWFD
jgi:hypothetical protein